MQQDPVRPREPKRNIFQAARREIELKERHAKARLIQQWWRRLRRADNPESEGLVQESSENSGRTQPKKVEFHSEEVNQLQFYSLPQHDGNPHEEEAVFHSYARFRLEEAVGQEADAEGQGVAGEGAAVELMREFEEATKVKGWI